MESLIALSVAQNASDLHLCSGHKPVMRVNGTLIALNHSELQHEVLYQYWHKVLTDHQIHKLHHDKQIDLGLAHPIYGRFRLNLFFQHFGLSAALRFIPNTIPSLDEIALPLIIRQRIMQTHGLILVSGATGSGKSTSLAALIQYINMSQRKHIVTFEDPIEFLHKSDKSLIQQREIATHATGFSTALRAVLRQDPDIILIGEIRDCNTIETALTLAETGHLVLASLHTHSAAASISRLIDTFHDERKAFIRAQLSQCLNTIICQKLVSMSDGSRRAHHDVLINTPAVSHIIREGQLSQLVTQMQMGKQHGMQLMSDNLDREKGCCF